MSKQPFAHLQTAIEQGVLVLTVTVPRLRSDAFDLVDELRKELSTAIAEAPTRKVALNLAQVEYFGSAGFRPLLSIRRQINEKGGQLVLCNLSPDVEEVLLVTRLISPGGTAPATFDVERDVAAAIARMNRTGSNGS
jgi:stage II sporulation protein AA (anti-sigma F factor antagonist)